MFPLYDQEKENYVFPLATLSLILLNIFVFFFSLSDLEFYLLNFGFTPQKFFEEKNFFTIFSSLFLHGSLSHLIGNLWFLAIFGDNVERKMGKIKFLIFYFLCGVGSLLFYSMITQEKNIPVVGASGAISGILGAYVVLFPENKIVSLVPFFYYYQIVSLPAIFFICTWFLYQLFYIGTDTLVAYFAHIGGFLIGILLVHIFEK